MKKIAIVGAGYVGLSIAVLLAQNSNVIIVDVDQSKIDMINRRKSPIKDKDIEAAMTKGALRLKATQNLASAVEEADFIVLALSTNYNEETGIFDTSAIDDVIERVSLISPSSLLIIKSTVPIGYTKSIYQANKAINIVFCPEFLREGNALYDNLYPSRIIVGLSHEEESHRRQAQVFAGLLVQAAEKEDVDCLIMPSTEAEAVKLCSNTFLAMRVAFFNELDTYAEIKGLNSKQIIDGVSLDPRIGAYYNNPSFGYGGYCLPKDTKQLLSEFTEVPNSIVTSIVQANEVRVQYIAHAILARHPKCIGIYRLIMKKTADNFRESAIIKVLEKLKKHNVKIIIYEPLVTPQKTFLDFDVEEDLNSLALPT
ncbi:MAG: nucleotide sugar dehydrogenase [Oscillospiraceae bacterium]